MWPFFLNIFLASLSPTGFCTGIDRDIYAAELPNYPDALFHPRTLVIGQEDELFEQRMVTGFALPMLGASKLVGDPISAASCSQVPAYAVRNTFVFHHKGGTLPVMEGRENVSVCHANVLKPSRTQLERHSSTMPLH